MPLEGKTCLITGATSGIGLVTATTLAAHGARILLVGRDPNRVQATTAQLTAATGRADHLGLVADLSSQSEVRRLADEVHNATDRLDVLLNNAGAMFFERELTVDGLERTFALNHLAYFQLTRLLEDLLRTSAPARVINVASDAHFKVRAIDFDDLQGERRYGGWRAYCQSRLANVLFTSALARRWQGTGITANSLHPGFVRTRFFQKPGIRWRMIAGLASVAAISPEKGAETPIFLAESPDVSHTTGGYFVNCRKREPARAARDQAMSERLWNVSAELLHGAG